MIRQVSFQDATFIVDFYPGEDEFTGNCQIEISSEEYEHVRTKCEFEDGGDTWENDGDVYFSDPDLFIRFLEAAGVVGGRYKIRYGGSPYWFFHDLSHAETDCHGGQIYVDSDVENRALFDGAVLAFRHRIGLGGIFSELTKAARDFTERFRYEDTNPTTDAIENFGDWLENNLTTRRA